MAVLGLADVTIEINDRVIAIKPNSLEFEDGIGELKVRAQSAGGGAVENVITEDAETKMSYVKFTLITEVRNIGLKSEWGRLSRQAAGVVIRLSAPGFSRSFRNMRLTKEPRVVIGVDADFDLEFYGDVSA